MSFIEILVISVLGGILSLDAVGVAQIMVSRPIVAATIAGVAFGVPTEGLILGVMLEMIAMETMPFGASRYLEWSSGSIVGAAVISHLQGGSPAHLLIALICGLGTSWLAGTSMIVLRKRNAQLVSRKRPAIEAGNNSAIVSLQLGGIGLDILRGAIVVAVSLVVSIPLSTFFAGAVATSDRIGAALVVALPTAVAFAACWRMFASESRRRVLLFGGLLIGTVLMLAQ